MCVNVTYFTCITYFLNCFSLEYNPKLAEVPKRARIAYAKFMTKRFQQNNIEEIKEEEEKPEKGTQHSPKFIFSTSGINLVHCVRSTLANNIFAHF